MREIIEKVILDADSRYSLRVGRRDAVILSVEIMNALSSKEFAAFMQRTGSILPPQLPDLGLGNNVNLLWSKTMSTLTVAMAAAINTLQDKLNGAAPTTDQITARIHSVVDPEIVDLQTKVQSIMDSEKADSDKLADVTDAFNEFTTAFAPASAPVNPTLPSGTPVTTVAPIPDAPASTPDSAATAPVIAGSAAAGTSGNTPASGS